MKTGMPLGVVQMMSDSNTSSEESPGSLSHAVVR